jgi:hypothetical protein
MGRAEQTGASEALTIAEVERGLRPRWFDARSARRLRTPPTCVLKTRPEGTFHRKTLESDTHAAVDRQHHAGDKLRGR